MPLGIPFFMAILMSVVIDSLSYFKRQFQMTQITLQSSSRNQNQNPLYDLPGCDFPIKASFSTVLLNTIIAILLVPLLTVPMITTVVYIFYGSVAATFIKMINMPLIVLLSTNYNRKSNARDRQFCNSRAWNFYSRQSAVQTTRENQGHLWVSHI